MLQRQSIQKLHGDECLAVLVVDFVDGADVGVIQRRGRLGFALKTGERLRVFGYVVGQELKGYEPAELYVFGFVDHTHPAAAEFLDDAIVRDGLADHVWPIMLGPSSLADRGRSSPRGDHIRSRTAARQRGYAASPLT